MVTVLVPIGIAQTLAVALVKTIGLLDAPAVALTVNVLAKTNGIGVAGADVKLVRVWASLVMATVSVTCGAAAWLVSPAWLAVMVQLPAVKIVAVPPLVPLTVHTVGVLLVNITGLPDAPPVAVTVKLPVPPTV